MSKKAKLILPAVMIMTLWATGDAKKAKDPFNESFFEKARLIMTKVEIDIYDHVTDKEAKETFIEDFWKMRDPYPDTEENEFKIEFDRRVAVANRWFREGRGAKRGWDTDRGRILLQLGEPDKRESRDMVYYPIDVGTTVYGYDIWVYYNYQLYLEFADTGGGQFRLLNYPTELLSAIEIAKTNTSMGNKANLKNLLNQTLYKDAENYWAGIYVGTLGFATNTEWLANNPGVEAPKSWDDLLKPEFEGQVMVAHPSTSGTSYTALCTVLQMRGEEQGWEYLTDYAGQMLQYTKSGAAPAKFVGQGEAAVGIVFSHDIVNEIENNKMPLVLTFPEEGTGFEIGGMGILKGAKHLDAAQKWFDWALTAEAQALGPKYKAYQAPTVSGVELSHPELMQVNLIDYDFQWCGDNKKAFVDKFTNEIAPASDLKQ